jgi:putative two-component system hydrogenase maturation factor HypX/HoxX
MRILLLIHGFNALSQRLFVELEALGHEVSIEFDIHDDNTREAIELFQPDLVLAPYLKRAIPRDIWENTLCLILHPGPLGDKGPSALDWAILKGESHWGATLLQAEEEMDGGPVWESRSFAMAERPKSSLYRSEISDIAVASVKDALKRIEAGEASPRRLSKQDEDVTGNLQPAIRHKDRVIDWKKDDSETILRKIRSADGVPGAQDGFFGRSLYLYDAHRVSDEALLILNAAPGAVIAKSGSALCRKTKDGALWIGHMRDPHGEHGFKLPAAMVLEADLDKELSEVEGYPAISICRIGDVTHLHFPFYNGAMSTSQCEDLLMAYKMAAQQDSKVIVLHGGPDFWSNGMHLNVIEASNDAANESWRNINAIDDLAEAIIRTESHLTVAVMHGNAGAGGVFLARACDQVWLRDGVILNPHYKDMGNLYGSEFWTYLLPRYAGEENANRIAEQRLPMGADEAAMLGLADKVLSNNRAFFASEVDEQVMQLCEANVWSNLIDKKIKQRREDEAIKPLSTYREEELTRMRGNFFGFDPSYHVARYNFVHKIAKSRTPITLARHRDKRYQSGAAHRSTHKGYGT